MSSTLTHLAAATLLCAATIPPCLADSFASSASSAGSASSGSVSDSIQGSSNSSTGNKVADGDYRVIETAALADRPGMLRLKLRATTDTATAGEDSSFYLVLPQQALGVQGIATGEIVSARQRPYGLEFARAQTREAFFLVLADHWHRDLAPQPVAL
jgi:hypothetical protein